MSSVSFAAFLINALVQIPVVALVAIVAARATRRAPARQQHRVWTAAIAGCVVLPLASMLPRPSLRVGSWPLTVDRQLPTVNSQPSNFSLDALLEHTQRTAAGGVNVVMLLGIAYAAFILYRIAALAIGWFRMRRIVRDATPHAFDRVPILASDDVLTPMTVGARHPVIIFPRALLGELSEQARTAIVGHELAHVERRDFLVNVLIEIVTLPVSFHPLTAMLKRRLAESRELACDEQVTPRLVPPRDYARVLIDVAAFACAAPRPAYSLTMAGGDFEDRIRRIVRRKTMKHSRILVAGAWLALAVSSIAAARIAVHPGTPVAPVAKGIVSTDARAQQACNAGRARDASAIPMLLAMLGDETPIEPVRCYGGGWSPRLGTFDHPSPGEQAALALASISRPAVGALVRALDDRAPAVRRNAAWAIGEVRGGFFVDRGDALDPLIRLLGDADATVRRAAAFGLSELKSRDAVEPLIVSLSDRDTAVRGMAVFALGEISDRRATPRLAQLVTSDEDAEVRRAAAWALGEIKDERAVDALQRALSDPRVRAEARHALDEINDD